MADFTKLADVEALGEVPENASVLVEVDGVIKRVPGSGLGGSGIKTAIIKDSEYDNAVAGLAPAAAAAITYECINMTFEEAYETMASGEPLDVLFMLYGDGCMNFHGTALFFGMMIGTPCIVLDGSMVLFNSAKTLVTLYWTADGLSTSAPSTT